MKTALVLYMPVIHRTYLELLENAEYDALFVIEPTFAIELVPTLRKDLRAVEAFKICSMLMGNVKKEACVSIFRSIQFPIWNLRKK